MKKTVLVTGGAGFIGTNFVRLLTAKRPQWRVINLDKLTYAGNLKNVADISEGDSYRFVRGDICDSALLATLFRQEKIDTVVHFAAESHVDRSIAGPAAFIETNIIGTFTLLEAARRAWLDSDGTVAREKCCFLHVSTDEVYGSLGDSGLFTETTAYDPRSPYSASKASSDHLASSYFHTYGLPVRITNCSNNYGPFQFPEKLIPLIFNNAMHGRPLPIYGDGKNVRDWLYVVDHCEAIEQVLLSGENGESYNIGGNNEMQNIEVVTLVCDLLDDRVGLPDDGTPRRSLITHVTDRPGHDRRYAIDARKIGEKLNWRPKVTFAEGIAKTIDWYLDHRDWVDEIVSGDYQNYYRQMYNR